MNANDPFLNYQRWKDFALRMGKTCYSKQENPDVDWILSTIEDFFECFPHDEIELIIDWDSSKPYPESHRHFELDSFGSRSTPSSVATLVADLFDKVYSQPKDYGTLEEVELLEEYWEKDDEESYQNLVDRIVERWESPVHCCIRAGLDLAYSPSRGVWGFTVGDVRQMYPEGIPQWIRETCAFESLDTENLNLIPDTQAVWL